MASNISLTQYSLTEDQKQYLSFVLQGYKNADQETARILAHRITRLPSLEHGTKVLKYNIELATQKMITTDKLDALPQEPIDPGLPTISTQIVTGNIKTNTVNYVLVGNIFTRVKVVCYCIFKGYVPSKYTTRKWAK